MITGVLLDMDGVLYHGTQRLDGAREFLRWLPVPYAFVTNNSSRTPQQVSEKLRVMDISVAPERIFTSSLTTANFLAKTYSREKRVFCIGEVGLLTALEDAGFTLTNDEPEIVVVGLDRELTAERRQIAIDALHAGATFIGTNMDPVLMTENGPRPGTGSIIQDIIDASGKTPQIMGKPQRPIFDMAAALLDIPLSKLLVIGDNLETDIRGAILHGMQAAFVLTGVSTRADYTHSDLQAHYVAEDLNNLRQLLAPIFAP
jgi:4-nitrophenyl phosphatase